MHASSLAEDENVKGLEDGEEAITVLAVLNTNGDFVAATGHMFSSSCSFSFSGSAANPALDPSS